MKLLLFYYRFFKSRYERIGVPGSASIATLPVVLLVVTNLFSLAMLGRILFPHFKISAFGVLVLLGVPAFLLSEWLEVIDRREEESTRRMKDLTRVEIGAAVAYPLASVVALVILAISFRNVTESR
jgi:hypothetical protein